ncbi:avidin [Polypterus senegalus]|uniref:avidin n=1 Tax=Polypterus senegalus TaxID=55291 RepID=UPI001965AC4A|nr:avidin [Polypterus senegalus]
MFRGIAISLILWWIPASAGQLCNLTGMWLNDLGSALQIYPSSTADIQGSFTSVVKLGERGPGSPLKGRVSGVMSSGPLPTFGFSVSWEKGTTTSWVGQCFPIMDGHPGHQMLKTLWLLRSPAEAPEDTWQSTRIGEDTFYKVPDTM